MPGALKATGSPGPVADIGPGFAAHLRRSKDLTRIQERRTLFLAACGMDWCAPDSELGIRSKPMKGRSRRGPKDPGGLAGTEGAT